MCCKNCMNLINLCPSLSIRVHRIFTNEKPDNTKLVASEYGKNLRVASVNESELAYRMDHRRK